MPMAETLQSIARNLLFIRRIKGHHILKTPTERNTLLPGATQMHTRSYTHHYTCVPTHTPYKDISPCVLTNPVTSTYIMSHLELAPTSE